MEEVYRWLIMIVQLILFNIAPTFIDIFIALVAFCWIFDWVLALVIFVVMFSYGECVRFYCDVRF